MLKLLLSLLLLLSFAACFDKSPKFQTDNQDKDQKNAEKYKKTSKNKPVETTATNTEDTKKLDNTSENKDKVKKEENKPVETTTNDTADNKKLDNTAKNKPVEITTNDTADTKKLDNTSKNKPVEITTNDTADTKKLDNTSKNKPVETTATNTEDNKKSDNTAENKDKVEKEENKHVEIKTTATAEVKKIDIIKQKEEILLNQLLKNIDRSRIQDYLRIIGNDNKEKAALGLIAHENFLNNLFTLLNIEALNDDCLAFNDKIKEEIKNKIKNEKIIENIDIKNFIVPNESRILINLDKLPEYLNNDEDIIKQIQNNINKQMDIENNSQYIISEFINYNKLFNNKNVIKAITTAIAKHINKILTDKSARIEFRIYMKQNFDSLQIFKFFNLLKNNLNDLAKELFKIIIFTKISQYQNKNDLNNDFGEEIDKLKEFIQTFIGTINQDSQKDNVAKVKSLLSI